MEGRKAGRLVNSLLALTAYVLILVPTRVAMLLSRTDPLNRSFRDGDAPCWAGTSDMNHWGPGAYPRKLWLLGAQRRENGLDAGGDNENYPLW